MALANRADIAQVMVDGRVLVDEGRYLARRDETAITREGAAAIERIWDLREARAAFEEA